MSKMKIINITIAFLLFSASQVSAYFDNYPPYRFKTGAPRHIEAKLLVGFDKTKYRSPNGKVIVRLKESANDFEFLLKDGKFILAHIKDDKPPLPSSVYEADLDKNGTRDFIVFYNYRGSGFASQKDRVNIFLKKKDGAYQKISYDTFSAGIEDFVDLDRNGRCQIIITWLYNGDKHNYFSYDLYQLKDYRLVNLDNVFRGFPKFVWITHKKNDKDTTHLNLDERAEHIRAKDSSIEYEEIMN